VHVFVGPTLGAAEVLSVAPAAAVHPPVAHGDLLRLDLDAGDIAVIVDGYFHHVPSIRHKEILWLLARGVRVVGCASMGALRAAELYPYGMVGNGVVFRMYRDGVIDGDDEVAVPDGPAPDYREFGVPLVGIRHATAAAVRAGALTGAQAQAIVEAGRALHYTVGEPWEGEPEYVEPGSVTDAGCAEMLARLRSASIVFDIVHVRNRFGVPCFAARVWSEDLPITCLGFGAHLAPEVALSRAVTEAAQGRLPLRGGIGPVPASRWNS
jgi:hypothetical protein